MASVLADLLVKMDVDAAKFRAELNKVGQEIGKVDVGVKKVGDNVRHLLELKLVEYAKQAAEALYHFVKSGAEAAEKMGRLAEAAGVPVDEFAKLSFAAKMVDMDAGTLAGGLEKLARNMAKAGMGSGDAARAFKALGIETTNADGSLRDTQAVFLDVANKFAAMENGAGKTALAMMIFGRSGAELIPLLNKGGAGIDGFGKKLESIGKVLTEDVARGSERFMEQLKFLDKATSATGAMVASKLSKPLEELVDSFFAGADGAKNMKAMMSFLADSIKTVAGMALVLEDGIARLVLRFLGMKAAASALANEGLEGFRKELAKTYYELKKQEALYEKRMEFLGFDDPKKEEHHAEAVKRLTSLEAELTHVQNELAKAMAEGDVEKNIVDYGDYGAEVVETTGRVDALRMRLAELKVEIHDVKGEIKSGPSTLAELKFRGDEDDYGNAWRHSQKKKAPKLGDPDATKEHDRALEHLNKTMADYEKKVATFGMSEGAMLRYETEQGEMSKQIDLAFGKNSAAAAAYRQHIIELGDSYAKLKEQEKIDTAGAEAMDHLASTADKMGESLVKLKDDSELTRIEWRMQDGDLKKYLDAMEKAGLTTDALREKLKALAVALDEKRAADEAAAEAQRLHDEAMQEAKRILESHAGNQDKYAAQLAKINRAYAEGGLTVEEYRRALKHAQDDFVKAGGVMNEFAKEYSKQIEDIFADNLFNGFSKGLDGMVTDFARALQKMATQALAANIVKSIFNPSGGTGTDILNGLGGFLGGGSGGGAAGATAIGPQLPFSPLASNVPGAGGDFTWEAPTFAATGADRAMPDEPFFVGEKGIELFTPSVSGQIVPHDELAASLKTSQAPTQPTRLEIHPDALHLTLREWFEGELARNAATRGDK